MTDKICNLKGLAKELHCSTNHVYKLIRQGMPYHQLDDSSRRYFVLDEVLDWLKQAGFKQKVVWR